MPFLQWRGLLALRAGGYRFSRILTGLVHYKNVFTRDRNEALIGKVTEAMVAVEGENLRPATRVRINEFESGDWAIVGQRLTTSDVRTLAKGKAA